MIRISFFLYVLLVSISISCSNDHNEVFDKELDYPTHPSPEENNGEKGDSQSEDLSYLRLKTSEYIYQNNGVSSTFHTTTQYDENKPISYVAYLDGKLFQKSEYTYNGLTRTGVTYTYDTNTGELESKQDDISVYLDDTFLRLKSFEYVNYSNGVSSTYRTTTQYDGKKPISYVAYSNGKLFMKSEYAYNGLTRTGVTYTYDTNTGEKISKEDEISIYLDDTFLRLKSFEYVNYSNGVSSAYHTTTQYDEKKPISNVIYSNGKLFQKSEYTYNGLTRTGVTYTYDTNTGEKISKETSEIEFYN